MLWFEVWKVQVYMSLRGFCKYYNGLLKRSKKVSHWWCLFSKRRDQYCATLCVFIWCNQELDCSSLLIGKRVVGQMISSGSPLFIVIKLSHVSDRTLLAFFSCCFILCIDMFFSCFSPLVSLLTVYSCLSYTDTLMLQKTPINPTWSLFQEDIRQVFRVVYDGNITRSPIHPQTDIPTDTPLAHFQAISACWNIQPVPRLSVYQGGWMWNVSFRECLLSSHQKRHARAFVWVNY